MADSIGKTVGSEILKIGKDTANELKNQAQEALKDVVATTGAPRPAAGELDSAKHIQSLAQKDERNKSIDIAKARQMIRQQQAAESQINQNNEQQRQEAKVNEQARAERRRSLANNQRAITDLSRVGSKSNKPGATFVRTNKEEDKRQGM